MCEHVTRENQLYPFPGFFALNEHAQYRLLFTWITEGFHKKGFPIYHSKKIELNKKLKKVRTTTLLESEYTYVQSNSAA